MFESDKILVLENRFENYEKTVKWVEVGSYGKAVKWFGHLTSNYRLFFKKPAEFVLVLFTGGEDVDPSFYNDVSPLKMCRHNTVRDNFERTIFRHALTNNIPMVGICRGFQFLNVMAKGRLLHHINGHEGNIHLFDNPNLNNPITVNSFHHQMVIPPTNAHVIGQTIKQLSKVYYGKHDQSEKWSDPEIEAAIFPSINACGVQYHPEWMPTMSEGFLFFYNMVDKLINLSKTEFVKFYTDVNLPPDRFIKKRSNSGR